MDNQHRKIKGYRELSQREINAMNKIKMLGAEMGAMVEEMAGDNELDQRWVGLGMDDIQKGLMSLTRAVAKPGFF